MDEREQRDGGRKAEKVFLLRSFFWQNTIERMNEKTMFLVIFKLMFLPKNMYTHTRTHTLSFWVLFQKASRKKDDSEKFLTCALKQGQSSFLTYVLLLWLEI